MRRLNRSELRTPPPSTIQLILIEILRLQRIIRIVLVLVQVVSLVKGYISLVNLYSLYVPGTTLCGMIWFYNDYLAFLGQAMSAFIEAIANLIFGISFTVAPWFSDYVITPYLVGSAALTRTFYDVMAQIRRYNPQMENKSPWNIYLDKLERYEAKNYPAPKWVPLRVRKYIPAEIRLLVWSAFILFEEYSFRYLGPIIWGLFWLPALFVVGFAKAIQRTFDIDILGFETIREKEREFEDYVDDLSNQVRASHASLSAAESHVKFLRAFKTTGPEIVKARESLRLSDRAVRDAELRYVKALSAPESLVGSTLRLWRNDLGFVVAALLVISIFLGDLHYAQKGDPLAVQKTCVLYKY